jgi:hypothetical protein
VFHKEGYCWKTSGGPLTLAPLRSTLTSTRSAILMKGMPLFIPNSLRSKAIVPLISPVPVPLPETVKFSGSGLDTPRIVNWLYIEGSGTCLNYLVRVKRN